MQPAVRVTRDPEAAAVLPQQPQKPRLAPNTSSDLVHSAHVLHGHVLRRAQAGVAALQASVAAHLVVTAVAVAGALPAVGRGSAGAGGSTARC